MFSKKPSFNPTEWIQKAFLTKKWGSSGESLSDYAESCVETVRAPATLAQDHEKDSTMSTSPVQNNPTTGFMTRFAGRMDLRLNLLLTCTAISITTAGLMA